MWLIDNGINFSGVLTPEFFYVTLYVMPASHSKNVKGILESVLLLPGIMTSYNTLFGIFSRISGF